MSLDILNYDYLNFNTLEFQRLIEERCMNNLHTNLLISDFIIMNTCNIKIKTTHKTTLITVVLNFITVNSVVVAQCIRR